MRPSVVALAVADIVVLLGAAIGAVTMRPGGDLASRVRARPAPAQVTPTGPWSATLAGSGPRFMMYGVPGAIPGALADATFQLPGPDKNRPFRGPLNLTLPDGSTWRPEGSFRLEASGSLAFESAWAREDCGRQNCSDPYVAPSVSLAVGPGFTISARTTRWPGEVAVAGTARTEALARRWDGLVGAVEGNELKGTATWDGRTWSVSAGAGAAHQVWMDVWPVATTTLSGTSAYDPGPHSCFRNCSVRFRWTNTGWATSHILEAEGSGPGSRSVRFGITGSSGHDAGLGVRRGGERKNLGNGDAISSTMAPGGKADRGLTTEPGSSVVVVLRGNFPDVHVKLAIR